MRVGVDTSVVLRLLIGEPEQQALVAVEAVEEWRAAGGSIVVSRLVLVEAYHALQYHYRVPKAEALRQLKAFIESPWVAPDEVAIETLSTRRLATVKPGFVDRLIHAEYLRGQRSDFMVTFEKAASKLEGTQVLEAPG